MNTQQIILILLSILASVSLPAQERIAGLVQAMDGEPLVGVNLFIEGTYDGTITDTEGKFEFEAEAASEKNLVVSYIGYTTQIVPLENQLLSNISIRLKESVTSLNAVTITAGSFNAGDKNRATVLDPMDIYTTAGSMGDINAALKTLPGTQAAADDGRLLVRGGEAAETKVYVDGLLAAKPYYSKVPDLPTRGRFSPSLFSGTVFSTGGYSAEYGQALSSVLILESTDIALEEVTGISLMSIGLEANNTWCGEDRSTSAGVSYTNLAPYYGMVNNRLDWVKPVEAVNVNLMHRQRFKNGGLFKMFATGDYGGQSFNTSDGSDKPVYIDSEGGNTYWNGTYKMSLGEKTALRSGVAVTYDEDRTIAGVHHSTENELNIEGRLAFVHDLKEGIVLTYGVSDAFTKYDQDYKELEGTQRWSGGIEDHVTALFVEPEIKLSAKFAFRPGLRYEYSTYLKRSNLSPRISMAYKTGKNSQLSAAYGQFFQNPVNDYLKYSSQFDFEKATHYILGFQTGDIQKRLFRTEAYYKAYDNLVSYQESDNPFVPVYNNGGEGYAKGLDIFYRDRETFKRTDYWLSYSYIDSKRKYKDYPSKVTPHYIAEHTFSAVAKYFLGAINTQVGATWVTASGKPYHQPGDVKFMNQRSPMYHDLSLNLSYLTHLGDHFTIIHFAMNNVLGQTQHLGYRTVPSMDGNSPDKLVPMHPDVKQFLFLGVFISIN